MFRWLTAGESHGPALVATLEGLPAGVEVSSADIADALARRRLGYGRGARMKFEKDEVTILGGVRHGSTLGSPIALSVANSEWPRWQTVMSADPVTAEALAGQARSAPLTAPRPGHADLAGVQKYGFSDIRPILERASARETAARVALGVFAKAFLQQVAGVQLLSHVVGIGSVQAGYAQPPQPDAADRIDADPMRCADPELSAQMVAEVDRAKADANTVGGVIEVVAYGLPPGLGSHVHWDRKLDGRLAAAVMSIQAIKGVEIGLGFAAGRVFGSQAHDEIELNENGVHRRTNRAGGLEGGITTGEALQIRAAMKPISTVPRQLDTIDFSTGQPAKAINQRSDTCAVPAAAVVAEAMVALILAEALLEKCGGDHCQETRRNLDNYLKNLIIS